MLAVIFEMSASGNASDCCFSSSGAAWDRQYLLRARIGPIPRLHIDFSPMITFANKPRPWPFFRIIDRVHSRSRRQGDPDAEVRRSAVGALGLCHGRGRVACLAGRSARCGMAVREEWPPRRASRKRSAPLAAPADPYWQVRLRAALSLRWLPRCPTRSATYARKAAALGEIGDDAAPPAPLEHECDADPGRAPLRESAAPRAGARIGHGTTRRLPSKR